MKKFILSMLAILVLTTCTTPKYSENKESKIHKKENIRRI